MLSRSKIHEIVQQIWSTAFGLVAAPYDEIRPVIDDPVTGWIRYDGGNGGGIAVTLPRKHAESLAMGVFGLRLDEVADEDVHDIVGEVANIVAGNFKALADPNLRMRLPQVKPGALERSELGKGAGRATSLSYRCEGSRFVVWVY